jgi:hypothetical protein
MDQDIILATKRRYRRKYSDEVMVVIEDNDDEVEDARGKSTLQNIRNYNIKSAVFNWGDAWREVKVSVLANCWKKILADAEPVYDFEGFGPAGFHETFS